MCAQADEPLGTFLDYCTYGHMIDNVVLLVTGTLHERDVTVSLISSIDLLFHVAVRWLTLLHIQPQQ